MQETIESYHKQLEEKESYYETLLQQKETDLQAMQQQVEVASKKAREEVKESRQKIEDSLRELEEHKNKRLTARNEMLGLIKAVEKAEGEGREIKSNIQSSIAPMINEQVSHLSQVGSISLCDESSLDQSSRNPINEYRDGGFPPHFQEKQYCNLIVQFVGIHSATFSSGKDSH